jgi:putative oxidoreductase
VQGLKAWIRHPWTIRVCQLLIGALLVYSSLPKIGDLASFAEQVHNYHMLPIGVENLFAMMLPWVEFVSGLALILGIRARAGAALAAALLAMFVVAVGVAMYRGLDIQCGCTGTADATRVGFKKLAEDVGWLAMALVASLRARWSLTGPG